MNNHVQYFTHIKERCIHCHQCHCLHSSSLLNTQTFGELAQLLLQSNEIDSKLKDTIFGCLQCGYCLKRCPMKFDAKEFMFHARAYLEELDDQEKCKYQSVRIDTQNNIFHQLKTAMNTQYEEAFNQDQQCKRLFLPSCHLMSKFPELTKKTVHYLKELDMIDGMTSQCCGHPLYAAGLYHEFDSYMQNFDKNIKQHNVQSIITPCPNCFHFCMRLKKMGYLQNVTIQCLSEELVNRGIRIDVRKFPHLQSISIHDSCPDRKDGRFGESIRKLFEEFHIVELTHIKKNTICCGCGGLVPPYSQKLARDGMNKKIDDFQQVNTDALITTCFNCFDSLYNDLPMYHFLEFLIERADYQKYSETKKHIQREEKSQ